MASDPGPPLPPAPAPAPAPLPPRLLPRLALTAAAAALAEAATYPLDTVKTQLQLQVAAGRRGRAGAGIGGAGGAGGSAPPPPPGRLGAVALARRLVARQGARALYAGLSAAALRHVVYTSARISAYELMRERWRGGAGGQRGAPALAPRLAMGLAAGAGAQLLAVPLDLVKVRVQADAQRAAATGAPRAYRGVLAAARAALAEGGGGARGARALWRGGAPAVQRAALVNLGELSTYDAAKRGAVGVLGDNAAAHAASSALSGLVAALLSTPADVVKTRLMAAGAAGSAAPAYRGAVDCLVRTVRREGAGALYRGFWPTWARLGPWQLVFWVGYEQLRRAAGMAPF